MPSLLHRRHTYKDDVKSILTLKSKALITTHPILWPAKSFPSLNPNVPVMVKRIPISSVRGDVLEAIAKTLSPGSAIALSHRRRQIVFNTITWLAGVKSCLLNFRPSLSFSVAGLTFGLDPLAGLEIEGIPFMAYIDAPHRQDVRMRLAGRVDWYLAKDAGYHQQADNELAAYDITLLLGMVQTQRGCGVTAEMNGGKFTSHVIYPNHAGTHMIIVTARVPERALSALPKLESHMDISLLMGTVEFAYTSAKIHHSGDNWRENEFLQYMVSLVERSRQIQREVTGLRS